MQNGFSQELMIFPHEEMECSRHNLYFAKDEIVDSYYVDLMFHKYMIFRDGNLKLDIRFRKDIIEKQIIIKYINHSNNNFVIHGLNDGRIIV